jgi:hypothetical protein
METKIIKKVKGSTMEKLFDSTIINIRYYKALDLENESDYDPEKKYKYEINIRHNEGKNAKKLFNEAVEKI